MPQRLLELFRHLLKVGEVTGALHDTRSSTIYTHSFRKRRRQMKSLHSQLYRKWHSHILYMVCDLAVAYIMLLAMDPDHYRYFLSISAECGYVCCYLVLHDVWWDALCNLHAHMSVYTLALRNVLTQQHMNKNSRVVHPIKQQARHLLTYPTTS